MFALVLLFSFNSFCFQGHDTLSLSLQDAKTILHEKNLELSAMRTRLISSEADITGAKLIPNPNLSVNSSYLNFNSWRPQYDGSQNSVRLSQKIELGGKRGDRIDVAVNNHLANVSDYHSFYFNALNDLKSTFVSYAFAVKQYELSLKNSEFFDKLVSVTEERYGKGDIGKLDLTSIKLEQFNVARDMVDARQNIADLENRLRQTLNIAPEIPIRINYELIPEFADYSKDTLIISALTARDDYISLKHRYEASGYKINLAKSNAVPDVELGVEYDFQGPDFKSAFGIGFSIDLPFFSRNQDDIQRTRAERDASYFDLKHKQVSVIAEVTSAYRKYKDAYEFTKSLSASHIENAETTRNLYLRNYKSGNMSIIELIGAEQLYISAVKNYYDALYKFVQSKIDLEKSVGKELF